MKTALQELIEYLDPIHHSIKEKAIQLLEVEKQQIMDANISGMQYIHCDENQWEEYAEKYYNETYNQL